jgi:malonyl-CoA/methylmalonyl-CoA synthetase
MNDNLYFQLTQHLHDQPDKLVIRTPGRAYTRHDMLALSRRMAGYLRSLDAEPGARVVVQVEKSPEAIVLYLACLQLGLVYVPLNPAYTEHEVAYLLADAQPALYVCSPEQSEQRSDLAQRCGVGAVASLGTAADGSLMEGATEAREYQSIDAVQNDELAAILYTSGTTGRPKGAMLTHANLASNALTLATAWQYAADDHLLHALPIFHTHGLFVACNITLTVGASMTMLARLDAEQLIDLMPGATVLMGVPTFYSRLLESPRLDRDVTRAMRLFVSGSAPLRADVHAEFHARTGHAILERYGMTETNMITSNPYHGDRRAGTVGHPLSGVEVRIVDRNSGHAVPPGEAGGIEVRGPNVFSGYWRSPEKTREAFRDDGFFITGDIGLFDVDGYLHIIGRDKDLVISGGFNVYPKEVEQLLDDLPEVLESAVIGLPHSDFGEAVTAVVVERPNCQVEEARVVAALKDKLAPYKQPKRVLVVPALPRNAMGKVQKNQLREQYADLYR